MDTESVRHKSTLANHPDVSEVLPRFVARLRGHVRELRELHSAGEGEKLRIAVHQLRGAGASFGFRPLTDLAGGVEDRILQQASPTEVSAAMDTLIRFIEQIEGY